MYEGVGVLSLYRTQLCYSQEERLAVPSRSVILLTALNTTQSHDGHMTTG